MRRHAIGILLFGLAPAAAVGQSSSLFNRSQQEPGHAAAATSQPAINGAIRADNGAAIPQMPVVIPPQPRNAALAHFSLTAVTPPEPKSIGVNDFIGVIVRHRLRYQTDSRLEQKNKWNLQAKLAAWFRFHDRKLVQQDFERGTPEVKLDSKNDIQNRGVSDRRDVFETRLKAKVIDVKPNGNLSIFALTQVEIDDEKQYIVMTGECNKADIAPDGNVTSDKIFNLVIKTDNDGAVRDAVKRGWFKEFLDLAKPF
jgi:flagellar basal body L-ring protein FlgH